MFGAYRNVHQGRSAVLFLSGPTLADYVEPEPNLIACGVNTVIFHRPELDYFFIQDIGKEAHPNSYLNRKTEYDAFKPNIAKFYGNTLCKSLKGGGSIPYQFTHGPIISHSGALIEDPNVPAAFSDDLANKLPAAAGSIAFPALQFLLWAGVKRIYIVGADILDNRRIGEDRPMQDYAKQNHLNRWKEFETWVAEAYPDVTIIPLNPIGLKDIWAGQSLRRPANAVRSKFVAPALYDPLRLHVLGIPHTITSPEFAHCAFTQKVRRFCKFMTEVGHTVYHYGHERSEVVCTEHITVSNDQTIAEYTDWKNTSYNGYLNDVCNNEFTANTIPEIKKRFQLRDFILCWYGLGHKRIADAFPTSIAVEPSIGTFKSFADFRIFESYALMHRIYGNQDIHPNWYDAVIPGFLDPEEFIYGPEKEDWLLYLGRVQLLKGANTAVEIARRTGRRLKIAGQGKLDETVPPFVEMVGYADPAMKADLLSRAAALVVPSRYCEPFGYNAIEAAMSGTPVISVDWGGFTETVLHGVTGYRCRSMDQFDWAVRNVYKIQPKACRDWALNNYTTENARKRYEEYFRQLRGLFFGCDFDGKDPDRTDIIGPIRVSPASKSTSGPEQRKLLSSDQIRARFNQDMWKSGGDETPCGVGSKVDETEIAQQLIKEVIDEYSHIRIVNDAGCGDMNWMGLVRPLFVERGIDYLGYDIRRWTESLPLPFEELDIINEAMRPCHLIICRDVLFHFPNEYVLKALENFRKSGNYLIATTTPPEMGPVDNSKRNILVGSFAPLDLEAPPFSLNPLFLCTESKWKRAIGLWRLE